jgi:hypothetical protein
MKNTNRPETAPSRRLLESKTEEALLVTTRPHGTSHEDPGTPLAGGLLRIEVNTRGSLRLGMTNRYIDGAIGHRICQPGAVAGPTPPGGAVQACWASMLLFFSAASIYIRQRWPVGNCMFVNVSGAWRGTNRLNQTLSRGVGRCVVDCASGQGGVMGAHWCEPSDKGLGAFLSTTPRLARASR